MFAKKRTLFILGLSIIYVIAVLPVLAPAEEPEEAYLTGGEMVPEEYRRNQYVEAAEIDAQLVSAKDVLNMASFNLAWHDAPEVEYGFGNRYQFSTTYEFRYAVSDFDTQSRERELYGYWRVEDNRLILKILVKYVVDDAVITHDATSGREYIAAGQYSYECLDEPEYRELEFGPLELNYELDYQPSAYTRIINDVRFWQFAQWGLYEDGIWDIAAYAKLEGQD